MTVVRETIQINGPEAPMRYVRTHQPGQDGAQYETIGISEDTVYSSTATLRRGVNAHSGKTWANMQNDMLRVYSWRGGRMRYYRKTRDRRRKITTFYDETSSQINYHLQPISRPSRLDEAVMKARGAKSMQELILREYPLARDIPPGKGVTPLLAQHTVQDFTRLFFGPSRYRKDLVRGVGKRGWLMTGGTDRLVLLKSFAPFVPVDWIAADLLEQPELTTTGLAHAGVGMGHLDMAKVRRLLRTASDKQVRRLFKTITGKRVDMHTIPDSLRSFELIRANDPDYRLDAIEFTDWTTLHDQLAIDQRRVKERNVPIVYTDKAKALVGEYDGFEIIAPADTHTLLAWGARMNNCIGGYGPSVTDGRCLLYAVLKGGEMIANMELTKDGAIRQLVGKHNASLPVEVANPIRTAVISVFPPKIQVLRGQAEAWGENVIADRGLF